MRGPRGRATAISGSTAGNLPASRSGGTNRPGNGTIAAASSALGLDTVRRPTGGRAVWHGAELTYAVAAPEAAMGSLREAYHRIHHTIAVALRSLGAPVHLAPARRAVPVDAGACFAAAAGGEVVVDTGKVVGSAQLRSEGALLQHGSVLLHDDQSRVGEVTIGDRAPPGRAVALAAPPSRGELGGSGPRHRRRRTAMGRALECRRRRRRPDRRGGDDRRPVPRSRVDLAALSAALHLMSLSYYSGSGRHRHPDLSTPLHPPFNPRPHAPSLRTPPSPDDGLLGRAGCGTSRTAPAGDRHRPDGDERGAHAQPERRGTRDQRPRVPPPRPLWRHVVRRPRRGARAGEGLDTARLGHAGIRPRPPGPLARRHAGHLARRACSASTGPATRSRPFRSPRCSSTLRQSRPRATTGSSSALPGRMESSCTTRPITCRSSRRICWPRYRPTALSAAPSPAPRWAADRTGGTGSSPRSTCSSVPFRASFSARRPSSRWSGASRRHRSPASTCC